MITLNRLSEEVFPELINRVFKEVKQQGYDLKEVINVELEEDFVNNLFLDILDSGRSENAPL